MKNYSVTYYNPFQTLENIRKSFYEDPFDFFASDAKASIKMDVIKNDTGYTIVADLPGFKKEDIHLDIEGDVLTLKAERHSEYEDENKKDNYLRIERSYGSYERSFDLSDIDASKIHAKYNDGVLTLDLPKKEEIAPASRRLEIE